MKGMMESTWSDGFALNRKGRCELLVPLSTSGTTHPELTDSCGAKDPKNCHDLSIRLIPYFDG